MPKPMNLLVAAEIRAHLERIRELLEVVAAQQTVQAQEQQGLSRLAARLGLGRK